MEVIVNLIQKVLFFEVPIFGVSYRLLYLVVLAICGKLLSYMFTGGK